MLVEHEGKEGAIFAKCLEIFIKRGKSLNIEMKDGAHRCANGFGVIMVNGGCDNSEVLIIEGCGAAHNCAKVARIGGVDKDDVRLFWGAI